MEAVTQGSKFHFYSFGEVSKPKPRGTTLIEALPIEKFTMAAGENTDNVEVVKTKGVDADGKDYEGSQTMKAPLTCEWLPIGEPNRVSAPDVQRGEKVIIYRYGDTNYYFWTTAFNNIVRKLETALFWFSGTPLDDQPRSDDNGYFVEFSTHDGRVAISTSKKNGEACRYWFCFNTKEGTFSLQDDLGNSIDLDSVAGKMETTIENEIIHNTKKYTVNTEEYIVNTKKHTVNTETYQVNASTSAKFATPILETSKDFKVGGASLLVGYANFTTGLGGGNSGDENAALIFKGNVTQTGNWTTRGIFAIIGNLSVQGTGSFSGNLSAPNI